MSLINCEVNLILTWSKDCVITNSTGAWKIEISDTRLYVAVVTLSTQDNAKLLQQLRSGFKRTTSCSKYQSSIKTYGQDRHLHHLLDPSFEWVNSLLVLSFESENDRTSHSTYYLPKVKLKDYNVMIVGKNVFDKSITATGQGDHYKTGCLLSYSYFKENCKIIATDLSRQQVFHADPRAIQEINFMTNLATAENTTIEEAKEAVLDFSQGTIKVLWMQIYWSGI